MRGPAGDALAIEAQRCSRRGWQWMVQHLDLFEPRDVCVPDDLKQMGELALLYAQAARWSEAELEAELAAVRDRLFEFCNRTDVVQLARKRPSYFTAYVFPYLALRSAGCRVQAFEDALGHLARAGFPEACERMPFRAMEIDYAMWKAGLRAQRPSLVGAQAGTAFELCTLPVYLVTWEIYSLTHTLFYLADFSGPEIAMTAEQCGKARAMAEGLLVHFWRRKDWDLSGELLLNLLALGQVETPLYRSALATLLRAWQADGSLPGPHLARAEMVEREKIFNERYHTTLVGLLLCGSLGYRRRGTMAARG